MASRVASPSSCPSQVFIELFFILTSMWMHQFYYLFGFLALVFIILIITCAEITIVLAYFQLCSGGRARMWRWRGLEGSGCHPLSRLPCGFVATHAPGFAQLVLSLRCHSPVHSPAPLIRFTFSSPHPCPPPPALTAEDYHWWWRAYLTSGSSALYLFLYSLFYFYTKLDITKLVPALMYFGEASADAGARVLASRTRAAGCLQTGHRGAGPGIACLGTTAAACTQPHQTVTPLTRPQMPHLPRQAT